MSMTFLFNLRRKLSCGFKILLKLSHGELMPGNNTFWYPIIVEGHNFSWKAIISAANMFLLPKSPLLFRTKGADKWEYVEEWSKDYPGHHQRLPSPWSSGWLSFFYRITVMIIRLKSTSFARDSKYQVNHPSPERCLILRRINHFHW